ncbi:MAG TPA: glycine betaine ABC transporter substrate-binding protein [Thermomicrobiales bacterium]|nr:glycine betaine ABC transporter substrate-binding protein [Thermomicrobiales bacterium]
MVSRRHVLKGAAGAALAGTIVRGGIAGIAAQDKQPVKVGSKNFTEQLILGEMYAQLLEAAGIPVQRRLNLGGTAVAQAALVKGDIDLYPEYTGTGLEVVLAIPIDSIKNATPVAEAGASATPMSASIDERVYQTVKADYKKRFDLVWLDQAPFNDTQALAVKKDFAAKNNLVTISDLAKIAGNLTIVAPSDFVERPDGLKGLEDTYSMKFGNVLSVEPGIRYQALENDQAQVVLAFGTDGQVSGMNLALLKDDKGLWPPYHVAPVVRQQTLDAYPNLADTLNKVAPLLTDQVMSGLNWKVDGPDKAEPADVAKAFLQENKLVS